jgi:TolB protein
VSLPVGPLRLLSATTGAVRVVLAGPVVAFFWSPDGRTLAALQVGQPSDGTVAAATGSGTASLARAPLAAQPPGVAIRLVFVDAASGVIRAKRGIRLADLFATQQLPYFDQYALSHRVWSADSRSLALPVVAADGTSGIEVIPADGSDTIRVADGVAATWSP